MFNYIINLSKSQKYSTLNKVLFFVFTFSLFFPVRRVFLTPEATLTGYYSDFTSFSLYLSDILLFLIFGLVWVPKLVSVLNKRFFDTFSSKIKDWFKSPIFWLILFIFISYFYNLSLFKRLNLFFLINTLKLIVAYGTFKILFNEEPIKSWFFRLFAYFCSLQSIIALAQFWSQGSVGLYRLGETHLSPLILGVAKIVSGGTAYIRGAGTFPHPNPLSAFLVIGVLISLHLVFISKTKQTRAFYSFLVFLNILGVTATFSRGAYLALAAGLLLFFGYALLYFRKPFIQKERDGLRILIKTPLIVLISIVVSFFIFKPYLLTRATFSDQATMDRREYNSGGLAMIKGNPIFGVGMGESLLHMEQALGKKLEPWDKQPPHNYFIIAGAELGLPVMLVLTFIFLQHLVGIIKKLSSVQDPNLVTRHVSLVTVLIVILLLMQFDHYFYTLEQTKLLLWTLLALISSQIKNPQSFANRG